MSRPLAQTLRPVNRLRAAPIAKCASMLIASDTQIAVAVVHDEERHDRDERTDGGRGPGDEAILERRQLRRMDVQFLAHHRVERLRRILHHRVRGLARAVRGDSPLAS